MPDIQTIATLLSTPQQSGSEFLTAEEQRRILAFQQLQKMAGATNMPIYSKGTGMLKVATGALGGFLEGQTERNAQAAQAANSAALMKHFMGDPALSGGQSSTFGGINPVLPPIQTSSVSPAASGGGGPDFSGGPDMSGGPAVSSAPMPVAETPPMAPVADSSQQDAILAQAQQAGLMPIGPPTDTSAPPQFQHVADAPRIVDIPPPPAVGQPAVENGIVGAGALNPLDAAVATPAEKYQAAIDQPMPAPAPVGGQPAPQGGGTYFSPPLSPTVLLGDMDRGIIFDPNLPRGISEGTAFLPNAAVKPVPIGPDGSLPTRPPDGEIAPMRPPFNLQEVSPRSEEAPPRPPADIPFKNASDITNPRFMKAVAAIESGGDPNAVTGSYKGKYQLSESEFRRYGGQGSIFDPAENTRVAKLKIADEANELAQKLGRPVTEADAYLAHQQGVGGATAHLTHPERKAWESMYSTAEGQEKGPGWAKQAIWGNIPDAAKRQFGSVDNVTSGQFANLWRQRYEREVGKDSGTPATATQTATGSPQPQSGPSPQALAQSLQNPSQAPTMSRERLAEALRLASDPRTPKAMQAALMGEITRQTTPEYKTIVRPDGTILSLDERNPNSQPIVRYKGDAKPTSEIQNFDYAKAHGFTGTFMEFKQDQSKPTSELQNYNVYAEQEKSAGRQPLGFMDYQMQLKRAGATAITNDMKGENEFSKVAGSETAKRYNELASEAPAAKQMMSDVATMQQLGRAIHTGKGAQVRQAIGPVAEALGVPIDGLSDIQAYDSIVNRVAPTLRVKGSGAQSDFELKNFLKALPSLGNTPRGNEIIAQTMQGLQGNKLRAAEIGANALTGKISRDDAEKQLRELPDPMEGYRAYVKSQNPSTDPVKVSSPEEARKLPKGTPIILPDGRQGVVP